MKCVHDILFLVTVHSDGKVRFRLWVPLACIVETCLENQASDKIVLSVSRLSDGWFRLETPAGLAVQDTLYRYRMGGVRKVPDPASRSNTQDVHGPSRMVDAMAFDRLHDDWQGHSWQEAVIYQLHVGTFTVEVSQAGLPEYFVAGCMPPWCAAWFIEDARHEI